MAILGMRIGIIVTLLTGELYHQMRVVENEELFIGQVHLEYCKWKRTRLINVLDNGEFSEVVNVTRTSAGLN